MIMWKNCQINGILRNQQGLVSTWNDEEVIDWLSPIIEAFRTHSVDGIELYNISQKQQSLKAGQLQEN